MKLFFYLLLCATIVGGMSSCKKRGCTDPAAGNYESDAEKDDGSCCYNRSVHMFTQTAVLDEFATSNHVAKFDIKQYRKESCSAADSFETKCWITNIASDTISFNFNLECKADAFTTIWEVENGYVSLLPPGDTLYYGILSTNDTPIEGKQFEFTGIWTVSFH